MNTHEILKLLSEYFSDFIFHELFLKEFSNILQKNVSGKEKQLFKQLSTQLNYIKTLGRRVHMADSNEQLRHNDDIYYSIHLSNSQYNVRLLTYIDSNNQPYFLCAFYERAGKSKTNYSSYLPVLNQRLFQLLGDDDNGK